MEVYQSERTAAELEYALGAVPSIGENNHWFIGDQDTGILAEGLTPYVGENQNWWVGETDTGVFAGGVKVEGAEVGQTVVVKAVDENGRPTEWAAVDRERKTKYITVLDKTFETDTYLTGENMNLYFGDAVVMERYFFYKTPEGKQLKAKRVWGYFTPSAEFESNIIQWSPYYADGDPDKWTFGDFIGNNTGICSWQAGGSTLKPGQFWVVSFSADKSLAMTFVTSNLAWASTGNYVDSIPYEVLDGQFPHISGIKMYSYMTKPIPAGSRMVIRAEVYEDE